MRRVIDDFYYNVAEKEIMCIVNNIPAKEVSEYDYGLYRAQVSLIRNYVQKNLKYIRFGKSEHAYDIGNNNAYEIIYTGNPKEEQICGLFHITDNMYGSCICWVSDIDEKRKTISVEIHGCSK